MYICKKVSAGVRRMWGNICVSCVVGELDESDSLCDMYMSGMCALRESAYEWVLALKKKGECVAFSERVSVIDCVRVKEKVYYWVWTMCWERKNQMVSGYSVLLEREREFILQRKKQNLFLFFWWLWEFPMNEHGEKLVPSSEREKVKVFFMKDLEALYQCLRFNTSRF